MLQADAVAFTRGLTRRTAAVAGTVLLASAAGLMLVEPASRPVILPVLAVANLLTFFVVVLHDRDGRLPVCEIGSVCAGITGLYAMVPLLGFWLGGLRWSPQSDGLLSMNPPTMSQIAGVAWRYVLYLASFIAAYLFLRGRPGVPSRHVGPDDRATRLVVAAAVLGFTAFYLLVFVIFGVPQNPSYASMRAGVVPLWDSLPPVIQLIGKGGQWMLLVSKLCLLALLFQAWPSVKARAVLIAWLALEALWAVSAMGLRRDMAMLLIAAVLLYHRLVKPLGVGQAAALATGLLSGLLVFGFARDFGGQKISWTAANEFQTLFANACDIESRRHGLHVPWQIYFSDLFRLVPRRWLVSLGSPVFDPSYWYLDLIGAPRGPGMGRMFGVVPQAMIGWDWPELALRGGLLGLIFAGVHRWYVRHAASLWVTTFYLFLCLWSYFTVRSTTFHFLLYVVYGFLPPFALLVTARWALVHMSAPDEDAPSQTSAGSRPRRCLSVYAGPARGGCYERMQRLVGSLLRRGWTVHFVGPVPPTSHPGLVFHPVGARGGGSPSLWTLALCMSRAGAVCLRHGVRDLWSFGAAYAVLLAPLRLLPGRRMATFLQGSFEEQERAKGAGILRLALARAVERAAAVASDRLFPVSRDLAERVGGRATVLPNYVRAGGPALGPENARAQLGLPVGAFLVGYAGSIAPIKGLETLVGAVALLPAAHVALLGFSAQETAYERRIRSHVAELDLGARAHLLAWAPSARPLLSAIDVMVLPSRHEGCPNVLLEAMALGRPCLGARSGGIEEILLHDDLLFPAGDAAALAARLKALQEQPGERQRLASLGRARAAAYDFDWDERAAAALESAFGRRD